MRDNLFANLIASLLLLLSTFHSTAYDFKDTTLDSLNNTDNFLSLFSPKLSYPQVRRIGDINGDGLDDLMISNPASSNDPYNYRNGLIYVVYGSRQTPSYIDLENLSKNGEGFTIYGQNNFKGYSLSSLVDINNDGLKDIIFGAFCEAYVIFGRPEGFADIHINTLSSNERFKITHSLCNNTDLIRVSNAGDFNNDGIDDIMIGCIFDRPLNRFVAGSVYILFGHSGNFSDIDLNSFTSGSQGLKILGAEPTDSIGGSLSSAGDFNADGIDDVMITKGHYSSSANRKKLYVIYGRNKTTTFQDLDLASLSNTQGFQVVNREDQLGEHYSNWQAANAGDFNGDGISDIAFSSSRLDSSNNFNMINVIFGFREDRNSFDINDLGHTQGIRAYSNSVLLGIPFLANSIDINGDGLSDIIFGLPNSFQVIYGYKGGVSNLSLDNLTEFGFKIQTPRPQIRSGDCVGDFNGDGVHDVVIATESTVSIIYGGNINKNPKSETNVAAIVVGVVVPCTIVSVGIGIYIKRKRSLKKKANNNSKKMESTPKKPSQDSQTALQWPTSPITSARETAPMLSKAIGDIEGDAELQENLDELAPKIVLRPKALTMPDRKTEDRNRPRKDLVAVFDQSIQKNKYDDGEEGEVEVEVVVEEQIQQDSNLSVLLEKAVLDEEIPPRVSGKSSRVD